MVFHIKIGICAAVKHNKFYYIPEKHKYKEQGLALNAEVNRKT